MQIGQDSWVVLTLWNFIQLEEVTVFAEDSHHEARHRHPDYEIDNNEAEGGQDVQDKKLIEGGLFRQDPQFFPLYLLYLLLECGLHSLVSSLMKLIINGSKHSNLFLIY